MTVGAWVRTRRVNVLKREKPLLYRGVALNSAGPGRVSKTRGKVFDTSPPCHIRLAQMEEQGISNP